MQAEGGVDEEFEVLLVPLVLVGSLDLLVAGACPALMDHRDLKVRTETGVSLDHPDPKEREVTSADLVLPVSLPSAGKPKWYIATTTKYHD